MAFLTSSSTYIENCLKQALQKENLVLDGKIFFEYVQLTETSKFSKKDPTKTIHNLRSRCRQITTNKHLIPASLKNEKSI